MINDIYDGQVYQTLCLEKKPLSDINNISLTLNTDGVQVYQSKNVASSANDK